MTTRAREAKIADRRLERCQRGATVPTGSTPPSPPPAEPFETETVRGYLHKAAGGRGDGMVLTHGAGGNCRTPLLIAVSEAFQAAGVTVLRCDLPFRRRRPTGPPGPADASQGSRRPPVRGCCAQANRRRRDHALRRVLRRPADKHPRGRRAATRRRAGALLLPAASAGEAHGTADGPFRRSSHPGALRPGSQGPVRIDFEMEDNLRAIAAPHVLLVVEGAGDD